MSTRLRHASANAHADKKTADDRTRTGDPARSVFKAGDRLLMKGNPTISRADMAVFAHRATYGGEWIHRSPVMSG